MSLQVELIFHAISSLRTMTGLMGSSNYTPSENEILRLVKESINAMNHKGVITPHDIEALCEMYSHVINLLIHYHPSADDSIDKMIKFHGILKVMKEAKVWE